MVTLFKKLNSRMDASISYNMTDTDNYYSGGIGDQIVLKFQSQFQLFSNFMKVELETEIQTIFQQGKLTL